MPTRPAPAASDGGGRFLLGVGLALHVILLVLVVRALGHLDAAVGDLRDKVAGAATELAHPAPPVATPGAVADHAPAPSVASLGEGRVLYATADGRIVELRRYPVSGELQVARVYVLEQDEARNAGDDAHRAYSGLYLVDLEQARKQAVVAAEAQYRDALSHYGDRSDALDRAQEAARALVAAGGADRLKDAIARRTAGIALGERGYVAAIPVLVQVLQETAKADLADSIVVLLRNLTGLPLDTGDHAGAPAQALEWYKEHKPVNKLERRIVPRSR
jgi:hypothetical protein